MNLAVKLSIGFLVAVLLFPESEETVPCDTKWIRHVYTMTCAGPRIGRSNSDLDRIPENFKDAFDYFKQKDPSNPVITEVDALTKTGNFVHLENPFLVLRDARRFGFPYSVLWEKLYPIRNPYFFGIRGIPSGWALDETINQDVTYNYRRGIDKLVDKCCSTIDTKDCNMTLFIEACKK